jgi:PEP-CTERM motif
MKKLARALLCFGFAATVVASTANAGLSGALVNVAGYYPDTNSLIEAGPNTTVSGAIEYPDGTFSLYSSSWQIDIADTQLTISDVGGYGFPYGAAPFNGWKLTIISGPSILSAVADASSQFNPVGISIVNGNELFLNYSDVSGPQFGTSVIDIATVPEPGTMTLVGLSIVGLLAIIRRRR